MKHPHKAILNEWMDNPKITIEWHCPVEKRWKIVSMVDVFYDLNGNKELRIKPEPKPDVVCECKAIVHSAGCVKTYVAEHWERDNLRLTFDGETGKLKAAEVLE